MRGLLAAISLLGFSLFSSVAIIAFSLEQTILAPTFLKESLRESEMYSAISNIIPSTRLRTSPQQQLENAASLGETLTLNLIEKVSEQTIDDTFAWIEGHTVDPPAFIPQKLATRIKVSYFLFKLATPLGIAFSLLFLVMRFASQTTLKSSFKAVATMSLSSGLPGLLIFIAPFTLSRLKSSGGLNTISGIPTEGSEPLLRFLEIVVLRLTLLEGVPFAILSLIGAVLLVVSLRMKEPIVLAPPPPIKQNIPGSRS